jgi:hypothetical protein
MNNRLYVLSRRDLDCSSPAVQSGHCVAEFCLRSDSATQWNNQTLVYLEVENLEKLEWWCFKLERKNINWTEFREPDLNNELTAICVLLEEDNNVFNGLDLLK